jgi:hypothetical protein
MSAASGSTISQEGRDLALMFALTNTAVNQAVLQEIYMKTFGCSAEEVETHLADLRKQVFADVCATLAKFGNLDVSNLLQSLGLTDEKGVPTKPGQG